jgi:hypothetical protein
MLPFELRIEDGEALRNALSEFRSEIQNKGFGDLMRVKDSILYTMERYENPNIADAVVRGISLDSPDYQTVRPLLEDTLNKIYEEFNRRGPLGF